ncbi:hypothetical protein QA596_04395 [Balneolales bacterium ANBcel1]|nr:hypothetical protein [Balneolales bacterium ANBcel1]
MKTRYLIILIGLSAFLLPLVFPWWIVVVAGLVAGWVSMESPARTFAVVFVSVGLVWAVTALYITVVTSPVLLPRMAEALQLPHHSLLFVVTVLTGALPASLAAYGMAHARMAISHF